MNGGVLVDADEGTTFSMEENRMTTGQTRQIVSRRGVRALTAGVALVAAFAGVFATGHTAR
jgi:hypothetical protein